ncbi:sigma 54-interacting transcriptional regulator [Deltaproteobacteria bacterium TL4]
MNTILIIDDDFLIRDSLSEFLSMEGYDVHVAENAEKGLQKIKEGSPQLIILDLKMPGMSGLDLLHQLKPQTDSFFSVLVLTGDGDHKDAEECYRLGVQTFLRKPVDLYELSGLVKHSMERLDYSLKLKEEIFAKEKAFRQLELQHHVLKHTFESMGEGVITLDENYHIKMISAKTCRMLELEEEKALARPAVSILGAKIAGPGGVIADSTQKQLEMSDVHTQIFCSNGAIIPVSLSVIPLRDAASGWLLLFRDLRAEERKFLEKAGSVTFGRMISSDPKMWAVFDLIDKVAVSNSVVFVAGESGTGKELVAREIHDRSNRAQFPFIAVNCAAISPNLLESEFFGHEKGAFTGAIQSKKGRFELADHGTLFLDEVGEIPLELQSKFLRVLQEQTFERVGGTKTLQVNVRIVAATNKNLKQMVEAKLFREDLYYRIHVIPISLPPLRERLQDIPFLVQSFLESFNKRENRQVQRLTSEALEQLKSYSWPGNIRELYHAIEHAFAVSDGNTLQTQHLPGSLFEDLMTAQQNVMSSAQNEKDSILQALRQTGFHKVQAAGLLGMHPATLYRKLKLYDIS